MSLHQDLNCVQIVQRLHFIFYSYRKTYRVSEIRVFAKLISLRYCYEFVAFKSSILNKLVCRIQILIVLCYSGLQKNRCFANWTSDLHREQLSLILIMPAGVCSCLLNFEKVNVMPDLFLLNSSHISILICTHSVQFPVK